MSKTHGWVTANQMSKELEIDKKELFKLRDNGTFNLGSHYAAFDKITFSRDSYLWNKNAVKNDWKKAHVNEQISFPSAA